MDKISLIKCGLLIAISIAWTTGWYHNTKIISREIKSTDSILRNAVTLMKRINIIETEIRDKSDQQIMNNEILLYTDENGKNKPFCVVITGTIAKKNEILKVSIYFIDYILYNTRW